ncbi:Bifunctional protein FolD 4 [Hibiscus syriacus]|uniref:methenyltetrahydrofolate cyclohydrolase n=1 Tax=Hibiscus syriacus TaxID=106335 RepID=A0A6A2WPX6_HIBSY|nr:Bifunctional protein FolD 4 [Hibiscus syriacus]
MASMIFTDPSSAAAVHRLPFTRFNNGFNPLRRCVSPLHVFSPIPTLPRILSVHSPRSSRFVTASMAIESSAKVIDGKAVAKQIREEISGEVSKLKESIGVVPGLAVILVGDRKDSATYVRNKKKTCESVGINSFEVHLPDDASGEEVLKFISDFNGDPSVHGILVHLPLPSV